MTPGQRPPKVMWCVQPIQSDEPMMILLALLPALVRFFKRAWGRYGPGHGATS
jgi:hypothetical protein